MKLLHFLIALPLMIFGVTWMFWAGVWWDAGRPAGWPSYTAQLGPFRHTFKFEDGYGAKYRALLARDEAAAKRNHQVAAAQVRVTASADTHDAVAQKAIKAFTAASIERIPVYVTPAIDRTWPLSRGFVRVLDAAALGVDVSAVPLAAGEADDQASPVAPSVAAAVLVANDGECHATAQRLIDLQDWVTDEAVAARAP